MVIVTEEMVMVINSQINITTKELADLMDLFFEKLLQKNRVHLD